MRHAPRVTTIAGVSHYDAFAEIYESWAADMTEDVPFYVALAEQALDGPLVELAVGAACGADTQEARASPAAPSETGGRAAGPIVELAVGAARGADTQEARASPAAPSETGSRAAGPIVELAVGTGRVAVPVARATGRRVIGIDSSPAMLERCSEAAREAGVELDLRLGDMRELELEEPAALVYCPYRSLLHLPTWTDKRKAFERVAASLRPGGRFAWNAFAFHHAIAARLDGARQEEPVPHTLRYAVGESRIDITLESGAAISLWWATKNEWLGLIEVAGLEVEALYGGFEREPFGDDSSEFVWIARKPVSA